MRNRIMLELLISGDDSTLVAGGDSMDQSGNETTLVAPVMTTSNVLQLSCVVEMKRCF
jgi:hypothetical protein